MKKPQTQIHYVEVYMKNEECVICWPDGSVTVKITPEDVVAEIKRVDAQRAKKNSGKLIASVVDWFNTPKGWTPPQ